MTEPVLSSTARVLILTPDTNSALRDFDRVFKPESEKLRAAYGDACTVERIPVAPVDRFTLKVQADQARFERAAKATLAKITDGTPWTHIIMVCHGWTTGIQLGFRTKKHDGNDAQHWQQLVAALKMPSLQVLTLYACSTGRDPSAPDQQPFKGVGSNSFADLLRDATGIAIIAHTTKGHATTNPNLIVFERGGGPGSRGELPAPKFSQAYRNAVTLLKGRPLTPKKRDRPKPPQGHSRLAVASIPLCQTSKELEALLLTPAGS